MSEGNTAQDKDTIVVDGDFTVPQDGETHVYERPIVVSGDFNI